MKTKFKIGDVVRFTPANGNGLRVISTVESIHQHASRPDDYLLRRWDGLCLAGELELVNQKKKRK